MSIKYTDKLIVSKDRLIKDLRNIGVEDGDHVSVALSFKSIGYVKDGPDAFIESLLEVVGSMGTIMMPTFTRSIHYSKIRFTKNCHVYDFRSTPALTGLVPETFRKKFKTFRSMHPTHSVAAIGKKARYLVGDHNEKSQIFLPYSRLAKIRGKVLCIGIGDRVVAIRHEAQYLAGLLNIVPQRKGAKFRDNSGNINTFISENWPGCVERLPELVQDLRKKGLVTDGTIGNASSILVPAKDFLENTSEMLRDDPTLNLCDRISCLWCRELERRINLYDKIDSPRYFQRNFLIIKIISVINWFRLHNYLIEEIINKMLKISHNTSLTNSINRILNRVFQ